MKDALRGNRKSIWTGQDNGFHRDTNVLSVL